MCECVHNILIHIIAYTNLVQVYTVPTEVNAVFFTYLAKPTIPSLLLVQILSGLHQLITCNQSSMMSSYICYQWLKEGRSWDLFLCLIKKVSIQGCPFRGFHFLLDGWMYHRLEIAYVTLMWGSFRLIPS